MKTRALTLLAAARYLQARPVLCAEPAVLMRVVSDLARVCNPQTEQQCVQVGECAAKECARVRAGTIQQVVDLLEPSDLLDMDWD